MPRIPLLAVAGLLSLLFPLSVFATAGIEGSSKIMSPYFDWNLPEENIPLLAKWDVVIVDLDQAVEHPDRLRKLRQLNPNIKLFAYIASEELADAKFQETRNYPMGRLASHIDPSWFLRDPQGNKIYFWPGSAMLNPMSGWAHELPNFIASEVAPSGLWDGVFLDNVFDNVTNFTKKNPIDLDQDGRAEDAGTLNRTWKSAMSSILREIHAKSPNLLLIGNGGMFYSSDLNGAFFEAFPSWNWGANFSEVKRAVQSNRVPMFTAINVHTNNQNRPTDYAKMREGLASAITSGAYYSFDRGEWHHDTLWWYDEYSVPIGDPRGPAHAVGPVDARGTGVWMREMTHGAALVNPTNVRAHIPLAGLFQKIQGTQDRHVNSGELVTAVDLPSHDGIVLLRRSESKDLQSISYPNGTLVQIFDSTGAPSRSFTASRPEAPLGSTVASADVTGDGVADVVWESRGTIVTHNMATDQDTSFTPFPGYTGHISFVLGKTNHDNHFNIVASPESGFAPSVRIFRFDGTVLAGWSAYRPDFRGGVRVAIGDLDGDGKQEIVTIRGPGGGPHVRIWRTDGTLWGGGWFAFDPADSSGSSIVLSDLLHTHEENIVV